MNAETLWTLVVLAGGLSWAAVARRRRLRSASADGDWGVMTSCARCGAAVPRWFLLDQGSPRGLYARYRYPISKECRVCRAAQRADVPLPWQPGESEWQYEERGKEARGTTSRRAGR